ncbi:MAG TPA: polysaccharide deacetylase family protein [Solirubrobacteraceae bacterium]|nr:polysaccharide deacetylase family protein [Solirubrobacteraceae bacterium]
MPGSATSRQARAATALRRTGLDALLRRAGAWSGLLVLNYHRIGDAASTPLDPELFSATPGEFADQIAFLAERCEPIGLAGVPAALRARRGRRVLVTFDDGYRDNFETAFPILRRHGVPATFFLATGFLDRPRLSWWDELAWLGAAPCAAARYKALASEDPDAFVAAEAARLRRERPGPDACSGVWMTWDMAREMHAAGMSFGGHTVDHPILARLSPERQDEQVRGCAARLREELGIGLEAFSYPVGSPDAFDATTQAIVRRAGCELAFAFAGGYARRGATDRLAVPRMSVGRELTIDEVRAATVLPQVFARW